MIWPRKWLSDSGSQSMSIIGLRNNPYGILPSVMVMSISLLKLKRVDSSSHRPLLQLICDETENIMIQAKRLVRLFKAMCTKIDQSSISERCCWSIWKKNKHWKKQGKTLGKLVVPDEWLKEATAFSDHVVHWPSHLFNRFLLLKSQVIISFWKRIIIEWPESKLSIVFAKEDNASLGKQQI